VKLEDFDPAVQKKRAREAHARAYSLEGLKKMQSDHVIEAQDMLREHERLLSVCVVLARTAGFAQWRDRPTWLGALDADTGQETPLAGAIAPPGTDTISMVIPLAPPPEILFFFALEAWPEHAAAFVAQLESAKLFKVPERVAFEIIVRAACTAHGCLPTEIAYRFADVVATKTKAFAMLSIFDAVAIDPKLVTFEGGRAQAAATDGYDVAAVTLATRDYNRTLMWRVHRRGNERGKGGVIGFGDLMDSDTDPAIDVVRRSSHAQLSPLAPLTPSV
jgi:hypothetical protein